MAGVLQHLRSSTLDKRPNPASMVDGQVAINYASGAPGMFFKDSNGDLVKVGPVHVGSGAPNAVPASGGTAGNSIGEQWLDTSSGTYVFKIWDGSAWRSEAGEFVNVTGDTMTGALGIIAGSEGSPSLFISGDADTGLYSPGANQVAISTNGTGRLFIDSSGNVGIGTSPGAVLDVNVGSSRQARFAYDSTSTSVEIYGSQSSGFNRGLAIGGEYVVFNVGSNAATTRSEAARIDSSGRLGLGTSSPGATLEVAGSARFFGGSGTDGIVAIGSTGASNDAVIIKYDNANDRLQFYNWGASAANQNIFVIDNANSRVGIGTTSVDAKLHVEGATAGGGGIEYFDALQLENTQTANVGAVRLKFKTNRNGTAGESSIAQIPYDSSGNAYLRLQSFQYQFFNQAGSSEYARIDNSGRLLVGTSTSVDLGTSVQIARDTNNLHLELVEGNNGVGEGPAIYLARARGSVASPTEVSDDDTLGYIVFRGYDGTSYQNGAWIKAEADGTWTDGGDTSDNPGRLVFSTTADGAGSPTERMRISQNGQTFVLSTDSTFTSATTKTAGTAQTLFRGRYSATAGDPISGTDCFRVYSNGNVVNTNNSYGAISDIKLKENVVDASSQWDDLKALQVRNYNFKEGQTHTQIGLIAQEVELVSPGLVSESPDRDEEGNDLGTVTKSVNYSVLYMKAVKALQEAMERIETLEASNADLVARVTALEGN